MSDHYKLSPEQEAMINRAEAVWEQWKDMWDFQNLNHIQRNGVRNILFCMQEAEHKAFGLEIPKGELIADKVTEERG